MKIVALLGLLLALTACGGTGDRAPQARDVALQFLSAYQASDGDRACALVAPETRHQLERQEQEPCAKAVLAQELPEPGDVRHTQVFGLQAVVVTTRQTVFLSEFDLGWRVTAAGCTARQDKPHDCEVQGA